MTSVRLGNGVLTSKGEVVRMFRLNKKERDGGTTIVTLDGQISGDCAGVVEDFCWQAASKGKPVQLYLRDVVTVDETGWRMLRKLAEQGIRIRATGVYISYMVDTLQKATAKRGGHR